MNKEHMTNFLNYLSSIKEDNESMSAFKKCREKELEHLSYKRLMPWCLTQDKNIDENKKKAIFFIAWAFSIFKNINDSQSISLGKALSVLRTKISEGTVDKLFNCVCSSTDTDEVIDNLENIIRLSASKSIKIDLVDLGLNVYYWTYNNEKTKLIWARDCYA